MKVIDQLVELPSGTLQTLALKSHLYEPESKVFEKFVSFVLAAIDREQLSPSVHWRNAWRSFVSSLSVTRHPKWNLPKRKFKFTKRVSETGQHNRDCIHGPVLPRFFQMQLF